MSEHQSTGDDERRRIRVGSVQAGIGAGIDSVDGIENRSRSVASEPAVPARLRAEWLLIAASFLLVTVALAALARPVLGARTALAWTVGTGAVGAFELWFLYASLRRNRHPDSGAPARTLGIANALTLCRGWLIAAVGGFAFVDPTATIVWLPAGAYGLSAVLDQLDGVLARTVGRRTELGASLDLAFDTLGFLVAPVVAVLWGQLPVWYLSLSAARYLFRAGVATRRLRSLPVYDLPASVVRRPLAGLQMAFISVALTPLLPTATIRVLAVTALVPSLLVFLRDYLAVAGHLKRAKG